MTASNQIEVRTIIRHGKQAAQYRSRLASGQWDSRWFKMTMADARKALRAGKADVGICQDCEVVPPSFKTRQAAIDFAGRVVARGEATMYQIAK